MYGVSAAFKTKVRGPHQITVRAEIWSGSTLLRTIEPLSGSVEIDSRRAIRRTCSLTLAGDDATLIPLASNATLTPYGNEIKLWRGVVLDDGTTEEVPLGVFLLTNVNIGQRSDGTTISLSGSDRSLRVQRARWTAPYQIRATNLTTALSALLLDRWPDISTSLGATSFTVTAATLGLDNNNDPWKDAQELAKAAGYELYFDGNGTAVIVPIPDYSDTSSQATYTEDQDAVLLEISRTISADETYNGVIVTGEGTQSASVFRGEAWDNDVTSPTYRYGPFGQVPRFYSSPLITSNDQAATAAAAILSKSKGTVEQIRWSQICDPSLEGGDVVTVVNSGTGVSNVLVIDRLTIPLAADAAMSAVARNVRTWSA